MQENIKVVLQDSNRNNMSDKLFNNRRNPMLGRVIVHEKVLGNAQHQPVHPTILSKTHQDLYIPENRLDKHGLKIVDTSNLIVYRGRHMTMCRMFNKSLNWNDEGSSQAVFNNMENKFVTWIGFGSGGAASNNSQNPLAVNATEWELASHGYCNGQSGKFITVNNRQYHIFDNGFPDFVSDEEVSNNGLLHSQLENVTYDENRRDTYLVTHIQVSLENNEGNGPAGSQEINEIGLFMAPTASVNGDFSSYNDNNLHLELFAKCNMPTITKNQDRSMTFSWFIFF
jgi:hypothetical protein